jgi:DNA-binding LacI/PurR family transcriptional regulator
LKKLDPYPILESRIRAGVYAQGAWLTPERELAREFGVHRQAIRRAVARLSEMGLLERRAGHRPIVRRPDSIEPPPNIVAFLMGNEPLFRSFQAILKGCEQELVGAGYRLMFVDTYAESEEATQEVEGRALDSLLAHPVAGLIIWCQDPEFSLSRLQSLRNAGTAIVTVDRLVPGLDVDFVGVDNFDAARRAVEHLQQLGHRRIALVTLNEHTSAVSERERGFRAAMSRPGYEFDDSLVFRTPDGDADRDQIAAITVEKLLASPNRPTAAFAVNDILAWRLVHALTVAGKTVPGDLAIVGFDDIEARAMHRPVLTTIRQPYEGIGRHAAILLRQRMAAPQLPIRHVLLDTPLIVRASTVPETVQLAELPEETWSSQTANALTTRVPNALTRITN